MRERGGGTVSLWIYIERDLTEGFKRWREEEGIENEILMPNMVAFGAPRRKRLERDSQN